MKKDRWKENVTSMGKKMVEYRVLVRKPEEKRDMFIGPCIIVITEEYKINLMSLIILLYFL